MLASRVAICGITARGDDDDGSGRSRTAAATTPVLYAYQRNFTFDANGNLTAVSAESRVTIDTPEACS